MSAFRQRLVDHIVAERERQIELWGPQTDVSISRLMNIITEEAGESAAEVNDLLEEYDRWAQTNEKMPPHEMSPYLARAEVELIQTAACCLKLLEAIQMRSFLLA